MLSEQLEAQLRSLLKKHVVFSILEESEVDQLLPKFELVSFAMGESILEQGEPGDCAFLIYSGRVRVFHQGAAGKPVTLGTLAAGDLFGERAILKNDVRSASCRASEDVVLFRIRRTDFEQLLDAHPALVQYFEKILGQTAVINFLRLATFLGSVPARQVLSLIDQFEECSFKSGEVIVTQGEPGDRMYIIRAGEVKVTVGRNGQETLLTYLGEGAYFGELALLLNQPRAASVVAVKETSCFSLHREGFDRLLAAAPDLRKQLAQRIEQYRISQDLEKKLGIRPPLRPSPGRSAASPALPADTGPLPRRSTLARLLQKYPWLPQHDETDCGAAALAMIARFHGVKLSVGRLRETANIGREGTSMYSLALAAETIGFTCRAVKTDFSHLAGLPLPAVAHWKGYHYLVLYEVKGERVLVGDPALGLVPMSRQEFEAAWTGRLLLLTPTPRLAAAEPEKTTFKRFLPFLTPFRSLFFEVFLASLILQLLQLASPVFTQLIVDKVLVHQNVDMLNILLGGMLIVGSFQIGASLLRSYLLLHVSQQVSLRLTSDLFQQILRLPMRYFHSRKLGDTLSRFADSQKLQALLTSRVITTVLDLIMLVTGLSLMLYYNVRLTLVALIAFPVYIGLTVLFTPLLRRNNQRTFEKAATAQSTLVESIKAIGAIKDATAEMPTRWKYEDQAVQMANMQFQGSRLGMLLAGVSNAINIVSSIILLWYGAHLVIRQELTVGQLMAFHALVGMIAAPIMGFLGLWQELHNALLSLQRLNDIYEAQPEQNPQQPAAPLPRLRGHLRLEDVSFHYNSGDKNVLSHISLDIRAGQTVAIVGRSGSGKTTLALLLQRFYLPTEGKILVDGYDLSNVDVRTLRDQLGVVAQESAIFTGTIRENIALSEPEASLDRVMGAARLANAHEFIMAFPLGYDTVIGEIGIRLSGGQRQRIYIARALLKDPRIILFDEATSALDTESEHAIQQNMRAILHDRTAILIAHRLSTIQNADLIVVLDQGQIVETGTHRELLERKGLYYYLASQQLNA
jgi:subfamily B ATP-binding cassette protein HlyB/CyaB